MVGMDIYEISGSHSGIAEDTILLLGCDSVSWGDSRRFDKISPFIFESRAVHEECRSRQTKRRHAPEHLTCHVHRFESQERRKFLCNGFARSGRTWSLSALRFSCEEDRMV